jgi:hypothetical protein
MCVIENPEKELKVRYYWMLYMSILTFSFAASLDGAFEP